MSRFPAKPAVLSPISSRSLMSLSQSSQLHGAPSAAPLSCPVRRPSHRPGAERPLTWEELLGRR